MTSRLEFDAQHRGPVLGLDEVGTGCIAGPVFTAGVISPTKSSLISVLEQLGVQDSKAMNSESRLRVYNFVREHKIWYRVECMEVFNLQKIRTYAAVTKLFGRTIYRAKREMKVGTVLVDGEQRPLRYVHTPVIGGDNKSLAIALASIMAKVEGDAYMTQLDLEYPEYEWKWNKGYSGKGHKKALLDHGPTPHHRQWTKPVREIIDAREQRREGASENSQTYDPSAEQGTEALVP